MAPTSNAPATAKKRQSCDRCHGQKLRCIRAGNSEADACNRCLRQGAHCVYSSSLPKGRPNIYRIADTSTAPSNPSATTPSAPELGRRDLTSPFTSGAETNGNGNNKTNVNMNEDPMMMDTFSSSSTWPWLDSLNWNDMQIDGSEQDSTHWASTPHPILDPHTDPSASFIDPFPDLLSWVSTTTSDADVRVPSRPSPSIRPQEHGHGLGSDLFDNSSNSGSSRSSSSVDRNGPETGIARLSQLSTRLYPLHRSSLTLAEKGGSSNPCSDRKQDPQRSLIDDVAFKSVAGWLVHVSANTNLAVWADCRNQTLETKTTGDTLHETFSASHQLLEILRCLQADVASSSVPALSSSTSTSSNAGGAQLDFWTSNITPQLSAQNDEAEQQQQQRKESSTPSPYARSSSNTVIRHLVHACHTLLLDIYVALLIALQDDAERWSSSCRGLVDDTAALADIPLVLTVQLCSYLIERQHQAVDLFLSSQQHEGPGSRQPTPPPSATNYDVMTDLKMEVQQRLCRLRRTLRI
ncbi:MAG: hypothetical protein LQ344_007079 [Seirophora lacunosa]|nr:MAG: hypothetical protein LQ344_007079 [Seirophora lacunosa]